MGTEPIKDLIFKLGVPIMIGMVFIALDNIGDALFVSGLGVNQLSAILICAPLGQAIVALGLLFGNGAGAYIPRLLGSKDMDRVRESVHLAIKITTIFCFVFSLVCAVFSKNIINIFADNNQEVITIGIQAILIQSFSFIFLGFYTIYSPLLLSVGKVKEGFMLGLCRQGICLIPMLFILPSISGRTGIIIAQPAADILSVLITFIFVRIASSFLKETENKIQAQADVT